MRATRIAPRTGERSRRLPDDELELTREVGLVCITE
jgi:hypothetical protein